MVQQINPQINSYVDPANLYRGRTDAMRSNAYAMQMEEAARQRQSDDRVRTGLAGANENGYVNPEKAMQSVGGDPDAMVKMAEKIKSLSDAEFTTAKQNTNFLGHRMMYLVNEYDKDSGNPDPSVQANAVNRFQAQYQDMLKNAPEDVKKKLPDQINPDQGRQMLVNAGMFSQLIQQDERNRKAKIEGQEQSRKERETDIKQQRANSYKKWSANKSDTEKSKYLQARKAIEEAYTAEGTDLTEEELHVKAIEGAFGKAGKSGAATPAQRERPAVKSDSQVKAFKTLRSNPNNSKYSDDQLWQAIQQKGIK